MSILGVSLAYVKRFSIVILLTACGGLLRASVIESLSIDLSPLHSGSILSGSVTLPNPLLLGNSALIALSFTDPSDYSPNTLTTTLSVSSGTTGDAFRFSTITFTNLANNKTYNLMVFGAAQCAVDFPCQATGRYEANSPAAFSGTYTIAAAAPTDAPEPNYGLLLAGLAISFALGRRFFGSSRGASARDGSGLRPQHRS